MPPCLRALSKEVPGAPSLPRVLQGQRMAPSCGIALSCLVGSTRAPLLGGEFLSFLSWACQWVSEFWTIPRLPLPKLLEHENTQTHTCAHTWGHAKNRGSLALRPGTLAWISCSLSPWSGAPDQWPQAHLTGQLPRPHCRSHQPTCATSPGPSKASHPMLCSR